MARPLAMLAAVVVTQENTHFIHANVLNNSSFRPLALKLSV